MTLRRLWLRAAARRPDRIAVVAAGLLAMTVAAAAAMVAGDALERVFVSHARARWGAIDVEVTRADRGVFGEGVAAELSLQTVGASKASSPRLLLPAVGRRAGRTARDVTVAGITTGDGVLGALPRLRGRMDPAALGPDEVIVNARLARRLRVAPGDELPLVLAVPEVPADASETTPRRAATVARWRPRVAGIARDAGAADLGRGANVFSRLGPLQRAAGLAGKVNVIHARAREAGARPAQDLVDVYEANGAFFDLVAAPVKTDALARARDEGGLFRSLVLALAVIVAGASLVLTAHLSGLLAAERAGDLALLRALGAPARRLRNLLTAEAAGAALVAAAVGALVSVPVGRVLAQRIAGHVARLESVRGQDVPSIHVRLPWVPVVVALAATVVVAIAAARRAATRATEADVDARLRDHPDAGAVSPPWAPAAATGGGLFLLGVGLGGGVPALTFAGTFVLGAAVWLRVRRSGPRSAARPRVDDAAGLLGLGWCIAGPALLDGDGGVQATFGLVAAAGAGAVACAALLLSTRLRGVVRFLRAYLPNGPAQAAVRTTGAWLEADRARTGAVVATVGALVFMGAAFGVVGRASALPLTRQSGGFDAIAESVAPINDLEAARLAPRATMSVHPFSGLGEGSLRVEGADLPYPVRAIRARALDTTWGLAAAEPGVTSAADAFRRVFSSRSEVILDRYARPEGAQPGDTVELDAGVGPQRFRLLAVLDTFIVRGVVLGADAYDRLFARRGSTLVLAAAAPGQSPRSLSRALETNGAGLGVSADTIRQAAADVTRANRVFTDVFGEVLVVGLGVAALGGAASYARAARARRRELGVLRALGLRRRHVVLALLAEPVVAGLAGVGVGIVGGLGTLRVLFATSLDDLAFHVDAGRLAAVSLAVVLLLALGPFGPARAAAGVDPDHAVRSPE